MTPGDVAPVDVLVIGESLVDIVDDGSVTEHVGGSPANVALGLGRRGVDVALLTQIAGDPRGRRIARHLEHAAPTAAITVSRRGADLPRAHEIAGPEGSGCPTRKATHEGLIRGLSPHTPHRGGRGSHWRISHPLGGNGRAQPPTG